MPTQGFLVAELSQIISEATAPAFLLGAVAAFISVLIGRLNRIVDRRLALAVITNDDPPMRQLKASIPSLRRRAKLLNRALEYAVIAAIFITFLVIAAFASAAVGLMCGRPLGFKSFEENSDGRSTAIMCSAC
jgi:uncharacterized protein DUF2721